MFLKRVGEIHLKMHDMAKLGYLLLKKGKWKDLQIVPEKWVFKNIKRNTNVANDIIQLWLPMLDSKKH